MDARPARRARPLLVAALVVSVAGAARGRAAELLEQVRSLGSLPTAGERDGGEDWLAISPGASRVAYVVARGEQRFVNVDGKPGPFFDQIFTGAGPAWKGGPLFSADSTHVAYQGRRGQQWLVVVDGKESPPYDAVSDLQFATAGTRLAYSARANGAWSIVLDGKASPAAGTPNALTLNPNGATAAYLVATVEKTVLVVGSRQYLVGEGHGMLRGFVLSPDGEHVAYLVRSDTGPGAVMVDGREIGRYDALSSMPVYSADSRRVAFAAKRGETWLAVVDGVEHGPYTSIVLPGPVFSADSRHVGWAPTTAGQTEVIVDGESRGVYDGVAVGGPVFSPDSKRVGWVASANGKAIAVVDGNPSPPYDKVTGTVTFSPDSAHSLVVARRDGRWRVVVDGVEGPAYDGIDDPGPRYSPDSRHLAYVAVRGAGPAPRPTTPEQRVVLDGEEGFPYDRVDAETLTFSPDSTHLAYVATNGSESRLVVDGAEGTTGFPALLAKRALAFDSPTHLHALVGSTTGGAVGRLDVDVPFAVGRNP